MGNSERYREHFLVTVKQSSSQINFDMAGSSLYIQKSPMAVPVAKEDFDKVRFTKKDYLWMGMLKFEIENCFHSSLL